MPRACTSVFKVNDTGPTRNKNAINKISLENNVELANEYRLIKNYAQTVSVFLEWLKSKLVGVISADSDSVKIQSTAYDIVINIDKIISKK